MKDDLMNFVLCVKFGINVDKDKKELIENIGKALMKVINVDLTFQNLEVKT